MAAPNRPPPRTATVVAKRLVTPNMLRVTLGGPGMGAFPSGSAGGYIKLRLFPDGGDRPVIRTYTVRHQRIRGDATEIDVDFVLHEDAGGTHGPATDWAMRIEPGGTIDIGGPGPAKPLLEGRDFYLIAGDMTALPAISVNLETLAHDAKGFAAIEIQDEADRQELVCPKGIQLCWIVNPASGSRADAIAQALRAADPGGDDIYAWVACEFDSMRALRQYLRVERGLGPDRGYISSYWKAGLSEEAHKVVKREDGEASQA